MAPCRKLGWKKIPPNFLQRTLSVQDSSTMRRKQRANQFQPTCAHRTPRWIRRSPVSRRRISLMLRKGRRTVGCHWVSTKPRRWRRMSSKTQNPQSEWKVEIVDYLKLRYLKLTLSPRHRRDDLWFDDVDPDDIELAIGAEAAEIMRRKQATQKKDNSTESALVKEKAFEGWEITETHHPCTAQQMITLLRCWSCR